MTVVLFASCQPTMEDNGAVLAAEKEAIRELLMNQQDDWNDGDIEAFMGGYLNSDSLRFASEGSYPFRLEGDAGSVPHFVPGSGRHGPVDVL